MRLSLALTTYERPDALAAVLGSLSAQRCAPDEVIVADDGSGTPTRTVVESFRSKAPYPVHHVRQEHEGFRVARLRNAAIARTTGDYVVFIDGDMVLHPQFIADHRRFARPGAFTQGTRVPLDAAATSAILSTVAAAMPLEDAHSAPGNGSAATRNASHGMAADEGADSIRADPRGSTAEASSARGHSRRTQLHAQMSRSSFLASGRRSLYALHSPLLSSLMRRAANHFIAIKSCNQGFWRADLVAVNGFDEAFVGWGPEDKELCARLQHHGVARQTLLFGGIAFHLHHPPASRERQATNEQLLAQSRAERRIRCAQGLDAHQRPVL